MNNFNEQRERDEQDGSEWMLGAVQTDLAAVPLTERIAYLPAGVVQFNNVMDSNGCVSRTFLNDLEEKLDYFYDKGMHLMLQKWCNEKGYRVNGKFALCDAYIEILSGTTPTGNSMKAPLDAIRKFGVIPAKLIPLEDNMSWTEYMNPERVTQAHKDLGAEFLRRFTINYEKVPLERFYEATTADSIVVALRAWSNPVDGVYPRIEGAFNHATLRISNEVDAFDTYVPFIKRLAKDYQMFDWGYSLSITMQNPYPDETLALFEVLQRFGLLSFFAEAWKRLFESNTFGAQRSSEWSRVRKDFITKNPNCAVCGKGKGLLANEVHHCIPVNVDASKELSEDNFITLCRRCHLLFGHLDNFRSWDKDIKVNARIMRDRILHRP